MEVYIDTREPKEITEFLKTTFPGINFELRKLDEGDYATRDVLVERKTVADLYGSVIGQGKTPGRWNKQVGRLSTHSDTIVAVLITGNVEEFVSDMNRRLDMSINSNIIYATIGSLMARERIHVMWTSDQWSGLVSMVKFMDAVDKGKYMMPSRREPDHLCARLLKITPTQFATLKAYFGSLVEIANAPTEDIQLVHGIGPKKAEFIQNTLRKKV